MKLILLTVPAPPNRANARGHWVTSHRERVRYECAVAARVMHVPRPDKTIYEFTKWQADFFLTKLYDADNLVSLCKWPIDTMVKLGFMKDDDPKHAWPLNFPTQTKCKKTDVRLELTLQYEKP